MIPVCCPPGNLTAAAHCRRRYRLLRLLSLIVLGWGLTAVADDDLVRESLPMSWQEDAELTDVFFLDAQRGWAVGAQGTILQTLDGGQNWSQLSQLSDFARDSVSLREKIENLQAGRQTATSGIANGSSRHRPLRCRFEAVHFVDAQQGWVLGRYQLPYIHRSRSVLLVTEDGGLTWEPVSGMTIPGMRQIQFRDSRHGWAVGDPGNLYPGGVVTTADGGKTWTSELARRGPAWQRMAATSDGHVTIDTDGQLGALRHQTYEPAVVIGAPRGQRLRFRDLVMLDSQHGFAVGDQGGIVETTNGGKSWNWLNWSPDPAMAGLQLRTLSIQGNRLWACGWPGARVVSLDLQTREAQLHRLPTTGRINRLQFVTPEAGWAVGDFGTILATTDGGQSWQRQRGSEAQVAVMLVADSAADLPLELLARYSLEENRICGLALLDEDPAGLQAARQAVERLGCTVTAWIPGNDSQAERVAGGLARQIRDWRPPVVVYHGSRLSQAAWQEIGRQAEQATAPDSDVLGLPPHSVSRMVLLDPVGPINLNPQRLLARSGQRVQESIAWSRALLNQSMVDLPRVRYRALDRVPMGALRGDELFSGLPAANALASRADRDTHRSSLAAIQTATQRAQQLDEFASFQLVSIGDTLVWQRKLEQYTLSMDPEEAGTWVMSLAQEYQRRGKLELAVESARLLATRWPEHPFAPAALSWLVRHYGSQELGMAELEQQVARGQRTPDGRTVQPAKAQNQFSTAPQVVHSQGVAQLVWTPLAPLTAPDETEHSETASASAEAEIESSDSAELPSELPELFQQRAQLAGRTLSALQQRDPELAADPSFRWLEAQLVRRLNLQGRSAQADVNRFRKLIQDGHPGAAIAAQREQQLAEGSLSSDASPVVATRLLEKPRLDGELRERLWQEVPALEVPWAEESPGGLAGSPIQLARLAYDDEYLYLGMTCQKLPQVSYDWRPQTRTRDADLARRDRIWICLDTDRDYSTGFQLEVDHRGWAREACDQSSQWDPDWYISQSETPTLWTIEAAIPLRAIVPRQPQAGDVWAVRLLRLAGSPSPQPTAPYVQPGVPAGDFRLLQLAPAAPATAAEPQDTGSN